MNLPPGRTVRKQGYIRDDADSVGSISMGGLQSVERDGFPFAVYQKLKMSGIPLED